MARTQNRQRLIIPLSVGLLGLFLVGALVSVLAQSTAPTTTSTPSSTTSSSATSKPTDPLAFQNREGLTQQESPQAKATIQVKETIQKRVPIQY